jgi:hypothetical protein
MGRTTSFDVVVKNANKLCSPVSPLRSPVQSRQMLANANSGRLSSSANQWVTFGRVSVHSQNDVAGTKQRHSALSHARQYGDFKLRTFVTGTVPRFGGGGKPQRYYQAMGGSGLPRVGLRARGRLVRLASTQPRQAFCIIG